MNAQDLKNSILQLAVQGKLVEQRPEEGNVKELLEQIKAEKAQLIKDKKIKKEKPLPEITEEEIPFEIPESWEWVRFSEFGSYKKGPFGSALTKGIFVPKGDDTIKVYEQKNAIQKDVTLGEYYISKEYYENKMQGFELLAGDIIVSCAGTIGETFVMPMEFEKGIINQALMRMRLMPSVYTAYFLLYFDVILKQNARKSSKGSAIKNIPPFDELKCYLVPLPPLAEQKRIITKIEEILPYIEQYDKAYTKLETFNKKFPEDMKKSILQFAMQGKLVEQRPEEGTAEELYEQIVAEKNKLIKEGKIKKTKSLPCITEDLLPCKIPSSWKACYIDDIAFVTKLAGFEYTKNIADNITTKGIPLFKGKNVQNGRLVMEFESYIPEKISDELPRSQIRKKCLLTPYVGTIGNIAIFDGSFKAHLGSNVGKIELLNGNEIYIMEEYVLYYLRSIWGYQELTKYKKSTAQESISIDAIRNVILLLPPLAEQKRIVAKLEQLLPYCDQLMK